MMRMSALVLATACSVVGCAGASDDAESGGDDEARASESAALTPDTNLYGNFCNKSSGVAYSKTELKAGQKTAENLLRYLLGDATAVTMTTSSAAHFTALRRYHDNGWITIESGSKSTSCGLPVGVVRIRDVSIPTTETSLQMHMTLIQAVLCPSTTPCPAFWNVGGTPYKDPATGKLTFFVDPEPAQTTASLSGAAGASAAAVFVNSLAPTLVRKWPAAYLLASLNPPVAGQPCATVDLALGAETTKSIYKNGSYYKCL